MIKNYLKASVLRSNKSEYSSIYLVLLSNLIFFELLIRILQLTDGSFFYSLDDPYIHLTLSDQIANGHYGLSQKEPASPSSSILYPFLLALFSKTQIHLLAPLMIGGLAMIASLLILKKIGLAVGLTGWRLSLTVLLIMSVTNLFGLPFNGMEHGLQIAVTLWVVYGIFCLVSEGSLPRFFLAALILSPLLRYEGLTVAIGGIIALIIYRRWTDAFFTVLAIIISIGSFTALLNNLGLPLLPNSVLLKSGVDKLNTSSLLQICLANTIHSLGDRQGIVLILGWCISMAGLMLRPSMHLRCNYTLAIFVTIITLGYIVCGHFGSFARYEIYAFIVVLIVAFWAWRDRLVNTYYLYPVRMVGIMTLSLVLAGTPYIEVTLKTPRGAEDIYLQQAQMRKLVVDIYRSSVAVNDIGLVSYRNPYPVVDLWGLGTGHPQFIDSKWMTEQVVAKNAGIAMIYNEWFVGAIPQTWVHLGDLSFKSDRQHVSVPYNKVQFYLTEVGNLQTAKIALAIFIHQLPKSAQFISKIL